MQTIQLLGGRDGRIAFLGRARSPSRPRRAPGDRDRRGARAVRGARRDPRAAARHVRARRGRVREPADRGPGERRRFRARAPAGGGERERRAQGRVRTGSRLERLTARRARARRRARRPAQCGRDRGSVHRGLRRQHGGDVRCLSLRVCALYPDLMNIYADRGNLLLLERRCRWRGIGFSVTASGLGDASTRERRPVLHRRRSGSRPAAVRARPRRGQARRAPRGRGPRAA